MAKQKINVQGTEITLYSQNEQLQLLANMEALNADYLVDGLSRDERRAKLQKAADKQLPIIEAEHHRKLKKG